MSPNNSESGSHGEDFGFSGYLAYNKIASAEGTISPSDLEGTLSDDSEPNPIKKFEIIDFTNTPQFEVLQEDLLDIASRLKGIRYISEEFHEQKVVLNDGTCTDAYVVETSETEILWFDQNRILLRGTSASCEEALKILSQKAAPDAKIIEESLDSDFLLWLFWKYFSGDGIPNIDVIQFNQAQLSGSRDHFGTHSTFKTSELDRSVSFISGLLSGNEIRELSGVISVGERFVEVSISANDRIHVKAAEALENADSLERMLIATTAADSLIQTYFSWKNLPQKRRYPEAKFFTELRQTAQEQDIQIDYSLRPVMESFAKKRGESLEDYIPE